MTKILVVDDEESIRFSFCKYLTNEKYEVDMAVGVSDAKTMLSVNEFDAAVIDRVLANGQNGLDLLQYIKNTQPSCETIIISAYPTFKSASETLQLDTFAYLTKPVKQKELCNVVKNAVENGKRKKDARQYADVLQLMFDNSPIGIMVCDHSLKGRFINPAFTQILGYEKADAINHRIEGLPYWENETKDDEIVHRIKENPNKTWELNWTTKDDRKVDVIITQSICHYAYEGLDCVLIMIRDTTEYKRMERYLKHAQKMEALGLMAGGIAHDLSNMMMVIISYSELIMMDHSEDSGLKKMMNEIIKASTRANILLKKMLNFNTNKIEEKKLIKLAHIVKEAMYNASATMKSNITITYKLIKECGEVLGGSDQLYQMFINLLLNAFQSIGEKKGDVDVTIDTVDIKQKTFIGTARLEKGAYNIITINDTGCGMDDQTKEKIFDPFFTTKKNKGGTGMGMSVVHGTIERHKGAIAVESKPGEGTCFTVYLPVSTGAEDQKDKIEEIVAP